MNYLLNSYILVYAKMSLMPEHSVVSKWLEEAVLDQNIQLTFTRHTFYHFLRLPQTKKIFNPILPNNAAENFITSFLNCRNVNLIYSSVTHFIEITKLMDKYNLPGNLVMDAHLAVLALTVRATLVTRDKDFTKIPYLKTLNPLQLMSK